MTVAGLLDLAAAALAVLLLGSLALGWWRPEEVFLALLAAGALRLLARPVRLPAVDGRRAVAVAVALYAALFSFVTVTRHLTLQTHALDLGYYVQLTWNLAGGRGPRVSLPEMHAWGDHLSPIMYLLVPAFWVVPGPVVLLVAQSVALGSGAIAVFAIARRRLGDERLATAFALLYLLNPSLHGINLRDFHAAALAIPLLLAAICFAERGRWFLFLGAVALTLACREDAAVAVVGLGAWLVLSRRQWVWGAATAAVAAGLLVADLSWIIPHYRGESYSHLWRYEHLGRSIGEVATTLLLDPLRAVAPIVTGRRLVYLAALLAPLAFLPLLAPADIVGALPGLAQNLLSADPILFRYRTQYQAFVLPFLVVAAIGGYARLAARRPGRWPAMALAVAMVASLGLGARTVNHLALGRWWPTAEHRAAYAVFAQVPAAAAVSAQDPYVPHLAMRRLVFVFPMGIEKSDHVLLNTSTYPWRALPDVTMTRQGRTVVISMSKAGPEYRYAVAHEAGPHVLLRRL